jgi:hypothetical protein
MGNGLTCGWRNEPSLCFAERRYLAKKKKYKNIAEIKSETNKEINIETMMLLTHSLSLISLSLGTSLAMSPGKMTCLINRETH